MVKPLKKDDISYEYIKTMPQELQDLLLSNDRVKEFNNNKNEINDINSNANLKIENVSNEDKDKNKSENNDKRDMNKQVNKNTKANNGVNLKNQPINLILKNNKEKTLVEKNIIKTEISKEKSLIESSNKSTYSNLKKNINDIKHGQRGLIKEEDNYRIKTQKERINHFVGINFGHNNKRLKDNKNIKINEQTKNSESSRRGLIIDKNLLK